MLGKIHETNEHFILNIFRLILEILMHIFMTQFFLLNCSDLAVLLSHREDGAAEVQLGQTHIMCVVSCQLVPPFPDRPNEGSLSVFTEFSPMADPSFEPGRQGENAVELGRVVDRGLRQVSLVLYPSICQYYYF